jgi:hypothetical protein
LPQEASITAKSLSALIYRRLQAQHVPQLAIKVTAHKLARIVYAMLKDHTGDHNLGELYYEQCFKERTLSRLEQPEALNCNTQCVHLLFPYTELSFQLVPSNILITATL